MPRFEEQVVFITGASRGLGFALAAEFGRRGATVAIAARHTRTLNDARDRLARAGISVLAIPCDVRDPASVRRALDAVLGAHGRLDVLVNNAGVTTVGPAETMRREDYKEAMATHFWGAYNVIEAALPLFKRHGCGKIVNVASIGGRISLPHLLPYSASKFALVGFSEGLHAELAQHNITVTTVCPGLMRTGSPRNAWFKGQSRAEYTWFALADALPGISIAASTAARQIVDACANGKADLVLTLPARIGTVVHSLAPSLTARSLSLVNRLLPKARPDQNRAISGSRSETGVTRSPLTALNRKAEREFNQRPARS
jgi:NAD(P)-dependent dehydrogenase (short-subunit alcohol dehydrogenase family)